MRFRVFILVAFLFVASTTQAQDKERNKKAQDEIEMSSEGFRFGIVLPILESKFEVESAVFNSTEKTDIDTALGFAASYVYLPVHNLGGTIGLAYLALRDEGTDLGILRIDANAAYAFTNMFHVKAGINMSNFTRGSVVTDELDAGVGFQASVGAQFTKNFGADVGYVIMQQQGKLNTADIKSSLSGFELGAHVTF